MKRRWLWFCLGLALWWLFLYWEKRHIDKMWDMYCTALGVSPLTTCERPWSELWGRMFLPVAVFGAVELLILLWQARRARDCAPPD